MTPWRTLWLVVATVALLAGSWPTAARGAEPLRLGALFPFSGSLALLGNETFAGVEVATEMITTPSCSSDRRGNWD